MDCLAGRLATHSSVALSHSLLEHTVATISLPSSLVKVKTEPAILATPGADNSQLGFLMPILHRILVKRTVQVLGFDTLGM